jgi:hypothetical protein
MKTFLKKFLVVFAAALVGITPTLSQAATGDLTAADVFPSDIDMMFELDTAVANPLEDFFRENLGNAENDISTLMLELADNNKINVAIGNISDYANEEMYLSMGMSAEDFVTVVETTEATELETYRNIKIYKMQEDAYVSLVKNLMVITSSVEKLKTAIDNSVTSSGTLGLAAPYRAVASHEISGSFFKMYMNPSVFMDYLDNGMGMEPLANGNLLLTGLVKAMDAESISVNSNDSGFGFGVAVHADAAKLAETGLTFDKYNFNPSLYQLLSGKGLIFYQERSDIKSQFDLLMKMIETDEEALGELNTFKVDFKNETLIDFDRELLPLLGSKYMFTVHNVDGLLPGVTAIFKVSDTNKAGGVALKLSDYLKTKLDEEQAGYDEKIFDSGIDSAGGTSFYSYEIYLKAFDDNGDLAGITDEAATLHIRLAVTTDGYLVISTLPDLDAMFRKGSEGLLDNAGLKTSFTNPTAVSNEVLYLDIDNLGTYVGVLMNIFDADTATKDEVSRFFAPWHGIYARGEATADTVWVHGQVNVDTEKLADFGELLYDMSNAFSEGFSTDYAPDLTYDTDILTPFGVQKTFCDVSEDDWFYPYVSDLSSRMIVSGYEDGCFRPNQPVTRAEFVKMAMKAVGTAPAINSGFQPFSDVPPIYGEWYSEDVNMAAMMGYVSGYEDGTFKPGNTVTRAEALQILYNMSPNVLQSVDMGTIPADELQAFSDVRTSDWFYSPVITSYWYGVISGPGVFEPNRQLNRAEAAKIISVLMELEQNSTLPRSTHD